MWNDRIINDGLNIVFIGWILIIFLFFNLKFVGVFINEFIEVMKKVEKELLIIIGILIKKCVYLFLKWS